MLKTATRASVLVSIVLVISKAVAWLMTGSVSILASLLDSLMDTAASLINMFAVDYALKPADKDHRFGHGKAEALAGLGQALFIALSAVFLLYQASFRLLEPQPITNLSEGIWVIVFAIVVTFALVSYQRYVVRRTGSTAVAADSLHFQTDLLTNVATLVALVLSQIGILRADSLIGLAIGLFILYSAARVGLSAVRILMDEELPDQERASILAAVEQAAGVMHVARMRSWRSGPKRVIELDVVFDGQRALADVHTDIESIIQRLLDADPEADISIRPLPDQAVN